MGLAGNRDLIYGAQSSRGKILSGKELAVVWRWGSLWGCTFWEIRGERLSRIRPRIRRPGFSRTRERQSHATLHVFGPMLELGIKWLRFAMNYAT